MKILHLIYTEAVAGAEKYLLNLLPGLKEFNIECHLICICPTSDNPAITSYCEVMHSQAVKTTLMAGRKINFISLCKTINTYLTKEEISIVHSHLSNADLLAVLTKIIYNKKIFIISTKHGYDERYLIKYSADAQHHVIDRNLYYYFTKFLLSKINVNLAVSKAISNLYFNIKLSADKYYYIHHGIVATLNSDKLPQKIPNQIIIIGRLEKMKGHTFLLTALPAVLNRFPDVKLLVIGEGSERGSLEKQAKHLGIADKVVFLGFQYDALSYLLQSIIAIIPSLFEPFGIVYIEAFSLKIPVIAFNTEAANEIITPNETGLLVPKYNSELLAEKIIYLLQNQKERTRISKNAHQAFLNQFTANKMIEKTANWYRSLRVYTE